MGTMYYVHVCKCTLYTVHVHCTYLLSNWHSFLLEYSQRKTGRPTNKSRRGSQR